MNVSAVASHSVSRAAAPITISASGWIGSPIGPLSTRELGALRAATGTNFAWPPTAASGVPLAALEVAGRHADELAAGMKMKELTAKDLQQLGAAGLLDAQGVARGVAYLQNDQSAPAASTAADDAGTLPRPVSGTVATDGSVYL